MAVGEWDQRQLCPDGGCVGVIGPDGTCKVCGRAAQNWGDERNRGLIDPPEDDEDEDDEDDEADEADEADELAADAARNDDDDADDDDEDDDEDEDDDDDGDTNDKDDEDDDRAPDRTVAASSSSGDWGSRQVCPDGSCIGLIGPGGRCKVCGRAASSAARAVTPGADKATATDGEPPSMKAVSGITSELSDDRAAGTAEGPDGQTRQKCSVTTCTGMVGVDGQCEVCGKVVA